MTSAELVICPGKHLVLSKQPTFSKLTTKNVTYTVHSYETGAIWEFSGVLSCESRLRAASEATFIEAACQQDSVMEAAC